MEQRLSIASEREQDETEAPGSLLLAGGGVGLRGAEQSGHIPLINGPMH